MSDVHADESNSLAELLFGYESVLFEQRHTTSLLFFVWKDETELVFEKPKLKIVDVLADDMA